MTTDSLQDTTPETATSTVERWWRAWVGEDPVMIATPRWYKRPPAPVAELIRSRLPQAEMTLGLLETATTVGDAGHWWLGVTHDRVFLCAAAPGPDGNTEWVELGARVEVAITESLLGRDGIVIGTWTLQGPRLGISLRELATFAASGPARRFLDAGRMSVELGDGDAGLVLLNVALEALRGEAVEGWRDAPGAMLAELVPLRARAAAAAGRFEALDETLRFGLEVFNTTQLEAMGTTLNVARGVWHEALGHALFTARRYAEARTRFADIPRHRAALKPWSQWWVARCDEALEAAPAELERVYAELRHMWRSDPVRIAPDGRDWLFETGRALPDVLLHLSRVLTRRDKHDEALDLAREALERAPLCTAVVQRWLQLHPDPDRWDALTSRAFALLALLSPTAVEPFAAHASLAAARRGAVCAPVTWGDWVKTCDDLLLHPAVRGFFQMINQGIHRQFAATPSTANLHFLFRPRGQDAEGLQSALAGARRLVADDVVIDARLCAEWYGVETREAPDGRYFLLLGEQHLQRDHERFLDAAAWTFHVTGQLALIHRNLALLGTEEYRAALTNAVIDLGPAAIGFVPVVGHPVEKGINLARRWWGKGTRALNFLSRHTSTPVVRILKASQARVPTGGALGKAQLAENALHCVCSADRYALMATGDLHAAVRAMLLTSRTASARAQRLRAHDLSDVLDLAGADATEREASEMIQLQFRITELARFVVSSDLDEVVAASLKAITD